MTGTFTVWGLLAAAAVVAALLARRVRPPSGASVGVVRLGPAHALHVVELEGRRFLVGVGPNAAPRLVAELEPDPRSGTVRPVAAGRAAQAPGSRGEEAA